MDGRLLGLLICLYVMSCADAGNPSIELKIWKSIRENDTEARKFIPGAVKKPFSVSFSLNLYSLSDYDPTKLTLKIRYLTTSTWSVPTYTWNPKDYAAVDKIHPSPNEIWTPDIVPLRHAGSEEGHETTRTSVMNNGKVYYNKLMMTTTECSRKSKSRFPREQVVCGLVFGSWMYDSEAMNITMNDEIKSLIKSLDWSPLSSNGWKLVRASAEYEIKRQSCCNEKYPRIIVKIVIERNNVFYAMAASVSGVVTGLMVVVLNLLNPKSPARIVSQMMCLFIFVYLAISDEFIMESGMDIGQSGFYVTGAMILNLLALIWSVAMSMFWTHVSFNKNIQYLLLNKLQRICPLPGDRAPHVDEQNADLISMDGKSNPKAMLTDTQRLCLGLDRLFSICLFIIFLLLFHKLAA